MKEQNEKQAIEEMAKYCPYYFGEKCCIDEVSEKCDMICQFGTYAKALYNADYHKQIKAEWILTSTFKSTFPLLVADFHEACSICGWIPSKYSDNYKKYNFCPDCGAHMKGGAE